MTMKTNCSPVLPPVGVRPGAVALVLVLALGLGFVSRAGAQTIRRLTGHVPPAAANLAPTGRVAAETPMRLSIGLPLRNREALANLLQALYDPASPSFRHFVTVDEFTRRFGPTAEDYQKVIDFAASRGLAVQVKHPNRMLVEVTARAADIETAFQVTLRQYRHPTEDRTFFAPDSEPVVEAGLPILHVGGLDNYVVPRPLVHARPAGAPGPASGSGPGGTYAGNDFRAAYVPGTTLTGTGQSVGLLEYAGYYASDIQAYESNYSLPNVPLNNVLLDGIGSITDNAGGAEQPLDIEMAISMAPGLSQVIIYYGNSGDDILNRMATDNLAKQLSASWTYGIDDTTLQIFQEFVAQGQNYFNASGDGDAYSAGAATPTDAPYITCVGGTTLSTSGPGGSWISETAWNWGGTGSSGGVSVTYALPMWQEGVSMTANQGSTTMRNIPDVALTADNIWVLHDNGSAGSYGGTSCATPLWAGFLALANEQAANDSLPPVGFINPAVYAIGKGNSGSSYASTFHDITTGNNTNVASPAKYFAVTGYDLCTGWGTPRGASLINALAGSGVTNILLYAAPVALTMTAGGKATVLLTQVAMNTANSSVSLSVTNLPSGVTASFSPSSTTSTSILTLTAGSTAATGTVTLTITGTTASATNTATVNLTVLAPAPGATAVNLSSVFTTTGIYKDGSHFSGGLDGNGNAFSGTLLPGGLSFNGCVFTLGPAGAADAIKCDGLYVTLPAGRYSCLNLLATGVNGNQVNQSFVVNYTDGTSSAFIQSVSDWAVMTSYPGQTLVSFMGCNNTGGGGQGRTVSASIYGYSFALNPDKVVKNIKFPVNSSVLVLGISLANDFSLCPSPFAPTLTAGGREVVLLNAAPLNGLTGGIALSVTNLSKGVTASFNPSPAAGTSLLTLAASSAAMPSNSQIMLSGSLGGVTHSVTLGLGVLAATPGAAAASVAPVYNCEGLSTDGATFNAASSMDGNGNCYSSTLLGTGPSWNGSVFGAGAANTMNAVQCSGQTVSLPAGQFPVLLMLGAAVSGNQPGQTFTVTYTDGAVSTFTQSLSAWTAANHYAGEAVAASMAYMNTSAGASNSASPVNLYGYAFSLDDTKTVQSITLPGNTNVVVLALCLANAPWSVPLAPYFNAVGLAADGAAFSGGADNWGYAYSANLVGAAQIWNSTPFSLGLANASNIVRCAGQTISLPPERETQVCLLAAGVNGNQASQTFTVTYTNGTTSLFTQSLSDWATPQSYAGESVVTTMPYRDVSSGAQNNTTVNLYGYGFTLDNTRVAMSLTLPNNGNVVVLGVTVQNAPVPVSLSSDYNLAGIYSDGTTFTNGGTDGDGNAYSANQLGADRFWKNMLFNFGPININNTVNCAGQTLALPIGQYASVSLLAAGVNGNQTSQQFMITYTNNATTTFTQSFSDWVVPTAYPGQTTVLTMPYHDSKGGGYDYSEANLYGYTFPLNSAYVAQSLTLPNNGNVVILAITLANATTALTEAPSIARPPQGLTVTNGGPASFSVAAIGTPTLSYRWQFNGSNLADGGEISGSGTSNLTLSATTTNDAGSYAVVVTNTYGSVTSAPAVLTLTWPAPLLLPALDAQAGLITFTWTAAPGQQYQVRYTGDLSSGSWTNLGPPIMTTNSSITNSDTIGPDPQRFYQLLLVQ